MNILFLGITQFKTEHSKYVESISLFKDVPILLKAVRLIWFKFNLPFKSIWINKLVKSQIVNYDVIILSATVFNNKLIPIIDKWSKSDSRLILWFWNPVEKVGNPTILSKRWRKVCFDLMDSQKFSIDFNNTYYFKDLVTLKDITKIEIRKNKSVYFLGQDKGRLRDLIDIKKTLNSYFIDVDLHVVKDRTSTIVDFIYKPKVTYAEVISMIQYHDILLDYNQVGQSGLTLRIMEGLFFEKKVITNNVFVKEYDFYNPANIFILDMDPIENIIDFVKTDFEKVPDEILSRYEFQNWLNRLIYG